MFTSDWMYVTDLSGIEDTILSCVLTGLINIHFRFLPLKTIIKNTFESPLTHGVDNIS